MKAEVLLDTAYAIALSSPNGQPHRVAPTNFGETEPLPNSAKELLSTAGRSTVST